MTPSIAILGAGPSGLLLARLLQVKNIDYVVFERDTSSVTAGAGGTLDIHTGSGLLALERAGLLDQFKTLARYDGQAMKVVDSNMNVVADMGADGQDDRPEIDRKVLRQLLLDSIPAEKVLWGHRVEAVYRDEDGSMAVQFIDGTTRSGFDLVVGADGAWSKARNMVTSTKPIYSGITQLQTTINPTNGIYDRTKKQCGLGSYFGLTDSKSIIVQRLGTGSYMIYVTLWLPEHRAKANAEVFHAPDFRKRVMEENFADWSSEITDLIRYSDGEWRAWPLYALPMDDLEKRQHVKGIALLGDAAHLGLPNGEGVNCAMFDSLQLAEEIGNGRGDLDRAVREYEKKMHPRGIEHIKDGHNMMEHVLHGSESPKEFREWLASMPT